MKPSRLDHATIVLALLALISLNRQLSASTLGTAFSYQSHLNDGPTPANGSYDLKFTPFGTDTTGAPVAGPITHTIVIARSCLATGWALQQRANNSGSLNWSNVTSGIQDDGTTRTFTVNPPTDVGFYRLHKP